MLEKFDTIIFDFDGVILNSMDIKGNGLRKVFESYPRDKVEKLVEFHHENGGVSRYAKIRYFFEELLGEEISEDEVVEYAEKFSKQMRVELDNEEYLIEDSVNFIKQNHQNYHLHIASGADENELQYICRRLDLGKYFKTIEGSPTPKEVLVEGILTSYGYDQNATLLIGDSKNDYEAARENEISFAGYNNEVLKTYGDFYIESFKPLKIQKITEAATEFTLRGIALEDEQDFQALIEVLNDGDDLGYSVETQWYRKVIEEDKHIIIVARYLGELVGVFTGMINTQDERAMNLNIAVHPKVRRRGLGTKLYKEGIKRAREKNIEKLEAYGKNRIPGGMKFLEKQGFSIGFYSWEMKKELNKRGDSPGKAYKVNPSKGDLKSGEEKLQWRLQEVAKSSEENEEKYGTLLKECFDDGISQGALGEMLKDPSIRVWYMEIGDIRPKLVGGLVVQFKENTKTAYLFDIAVRPKYRGKGMGLWMIEEVLRQLSERGYKTASLLVAGENEKALALYKKAGFTVQDEEIVFYKALG